MKIIDQITKLFTRKPTADTVAAGIYDRQAEATRIRDEAIRNLAGVCNNLNDRLTETEIKQVKMVEFALCHKALSDDHTDILNATLWPDANENSDRQIGTLRPGDVMDLSEGDTVAFDPASGLMTVVTLDVDGNITGSKVVPADEIAPAKRANVIFHQDDEPKDAIDGDHWFMPSTHELARNVRDTMPGTWTTIIAAKPKKSASDLLTELKAERPAKAPKKGGE